MRLAANDLPVRRDRAARFVVRGFIGCLLVALLGAPWPSVAQIVPELIKSPANQADARMLLQANELIYDFDSKVVSAVGAVEIHYQGYSVQAQRVTYYQRSGRLIASGGVRIVEPDGNVITASDADITDDLRDGFVENINVETVTRARFAAQSAERRDGRLTIFNNGVYTACDSCRDNPGKPPLWQIKAARIIVDRQEKTVYYENPRIEFYGIPVAYLPFLFHPDPTVNRKTGFLLPTAGYTEALGASVTTPFFWNIAPDRDITFFPTLYSKQGLLAQAEWRQRLMSGVYNIRVAGILQQDYTEFVDETGERLAGYRKERGAIQTSGEFRINDRWIWGWDLLATSDRTFGRDYQIPGATARDVVNQLYLTGLSERNYFDLRGYAFKVQREDTVETDVITMVETVHDDQSEQAFIHPSFDHNYIFDQPVLGGELQIRSNVTSLTRAEHDLRTTPAVDYYNGVAGTFTRASSNVIWQRQLIGPGGQVFTPFAYVTGDLSWLTPELALPSTSHGLIKNEAIGRVMPAVGMEYEWPFLAITGSATHTFGPMAQIVVRPDETHIGNLPNEDAQSLVFDDSILFAWDKFSGYDRLEGGTRANLGFGYQAQFSNGVSVDALVGQSYHLHGLNSFAQRDVSLSGVGSGLDSDSSDYVGRITVDSGRGLSLLARGRFDERNLSLNRGEIAATAVYGRSNATVQYVHLRKRPTLGIIDDRREISGRASLALDENWSVLGSLVYDVENKAQVRHAIGLAFDNECFNLSATYSSIRDNYDDLVETKQFFVRLNLRTVGDSDLSYNLDE